MLKDKGYSTRGVDPKNGRGGYVDDKTKRSFYIDDGINKKGKKVEPKHVDANYKKDIGLEKKKYRLSDYEKYYIFIL